MLKYNDNNIFVGEIKQLLKSFNLPNVKVYNNSFPAFKGNSYIYKGNLVECLKTTSLSANHKHYVVDNNTFKITYSFDVNKNFYIKEDKNKNNLRDMGIIKHLIIKNNYYDSYTHTYLGNYLRFLRDYYELNLMSLYNCFSNEIPEKLYIRSISENYKFDSSDSSYKIYMIPIKLFQNYTIATNSDSAIEMICGFYDKKEIENSNLKNINPLTYKLFGNISFEKPIVYNSLSTNNLSSINSNLLSTFYDVESKLKLFIKIPASNKSSIVVLEGDYHDYDDFTFNNTKNNNESGENNSPGTGLTNHGHTITNYEYSTKGNLNNIPLKSSLQLLSIDSHVSHPFADRLYEYLTENAITNIDSISDNIKRTQKELLDRKEELSTNVGLNSIKYYGIWENKYRNILYDLAFKNNLLNSQKDILGYVDKDVEKKLGTDINIY